MICYDYYLSKINLNRSLEEQQISLGEIKQNTIKSIFKENNPSFFYPVKEDLKYLINATFLLKIIITLKKPYTSKDEGEFHILDGRIFENPIIRDKFLGCPMVRPSTWKGQLRFAARNVDYPERERIIQMLFGSEPEDEHILKGRLHFFPTFFKEDGSRDVITPLDREKRTPTKRGPIPLEVIKSGTDGEFYLLYVPYNKSHDNENEKDIIKEDIIFLLEALKLLFHTFGFSAKKTSGFGVIEEKLKEGRIWIKSGTRIDEQTFSTLDEIKISQNNMWSKNNE